VSVISQLDRGCYEAPRAAALSGVPVRTVYWWAEHSIVVPSVSPVKAKLWSYGDLLTLRLVDWLRRPKDDGQHGVEIARTSMQEIRRALTALGDELWHVDAGVERPRIYVTRDGKIVVDRDTPRTLGGQGIVADLLDLFGPFDRGPDLRTPRPKLRIVPGKVAGEPHLQGSRLTTPTIAALDRRGYELDDIAALYPREDVEAIVEALDLERELAQAA
jgi:uncharacterized protein (DUF433 family)